MQHEPPPHAPHPGPASPCFWHSKFKAQFLLERSLRCPKCGIGKIVPLVYGFPSPVLRDGMRRGRLILGGDHLIEMGHSWACGQCRSSFRCWPYGRNLALWVNDRSDSGSGGIAGDSQPVPAGQGRRLYAYEL